MDIYFIRHTSVAVPAGTCYGMTDVPLADTFEEEATLVKAQIQHISFAHVFSSPLTRVRRLAAFCGYPDAVIDERISEFNFGEWEMQRFDDLFAQDPRFALWCDNFESMQAPGGECLQQQERRVESFVASLRKQVAPAASSEDLPVAVFCHGGVLAIAQAWQHGWSLRESMAHIPPYGSIVKLDESALTRHFQGIE